MDLVEAAWDAHHPPDPELIKDCVHCGFCLPTCPSYLTFEDEMDSPRGRIVLMRIGHDEGASISDEMVTHFDRCLGCMACVTACPSGVQYDKLIEQTRPQIERHADRPLAQRAFRRGIFELFTHPGRLRALAPVLALQQRTGLNDALGEAADPEAAVAARARPRRAGERGVPPAPGGHPGARRIARPDRADAGLHPARVLRRRQRRHGAGARRRGLRGPRAAQAALLRLADDARRARGGGARARPRDDRRLRGLRRDRGQRRRLRLGDEGLRAPARRRPRVGRARRRVQRQGQGRVRAARRRRAARGAPPARPQGRLPRRLPPRPRPGRPRAAARAAALDPRARARRARRVADLLRLGRHLQPRPARGGRQAGQAQGRQPRGHRARRHRGGQPRVRPADCRVPR